MQFNMVKVLLYSMAIGGCASPRVIFKAKDEEGRKSQLFLTTIEDSNTIEKELGKPPVTLDSQELNNKSIKVVFDDGSEKLLYFTPTISDETTILFSKVNKDTKSSLVANGNSSDKFDAESRNQIHRLLLKAYQALSEGNAQVATDLAKQVAQIDSQIAAPHILIGLSHLRTGNKTLAKSAFEKAKALDPLDSEIANLIELSQ